MSSVTLKHAGPAMTPALRVREEEHRPHEQPQEAKEEEDVVVV